MGAKLLNQVTGECVISGKGRDYNLVFDVDAVLSLEKLAGRSAVAIINDTSNTDCILMIMCGHAGWQRRNPGNGQRLNGNLAKRIFLDSGGYAGLSFVLGDSLSRAEGMGFDEVESDGDTDADAGPLALSPS